MTIDKSSDSELHLLPQESSTATSDPNICTDVEAPPESIYFGGCAWGCAYYVGVFKAMEERWGKGFHKKTIITGDSSGALIALGISLGFSPDDMGRIYLSLADNALIHGVVGKMGTLADKCVERLLSVDPVAYKTLQGWFAVGTTRFPFSHHWHMNWESNRDLADCILGSLHIPLYCCESRKPVQGSIVVDGAYSMAGTDLVHGDKTLYVGIDPHAEVGRSLENSQMLFPLYGQEYLDIVESGYQAMSKWDGRMNAKVGHRTPNYLILALMWPCRVIELFVDLLLFIYRMVRPVLDTLNPILRAPSLLISSSPSDSQPEIAKTGVTASLE